MNLRSHLLAGQAIPAHPLALDRSRRFSEKHQRALSRYYFAAGTGGIAVGVHSTQFEIRDPQHALFKPVLELAAETIAAERRSAPRDFAMIAGVCGRTTQAVAEAELSRCKQPIDDVGVALDAIVDERRLAIATDDEQGRRLALLQARRKLDVDLGAVVEGVKAPQGSGDKREDKKTDQGYDARARSKMDDLVEKSR